MNPHLHTNTKHPSSKIPGQPLELYILHSNSVFHATCHHSETSGPPAASPWSGSEVEEEAPLNPHLPSWEPRCPEWRQSCYCCSSAGSQWTACGARRPASEHQTCKLLYRYNGHISPQFPGLTDTIRHLRSFGNAVNMRQWIRRLLLRRRFDAMGNLKAVTGLYDEQEQTAIKTINVQGGYDICCT